MDDTLLAAERAVVGAVLQDPGLVTLVPTLLPSHFEASAHGLIFDACRAVAVDSELPDTIAVMDHLRAQGVLEKAGGGAYLHTCIEACPTVLNAPHYARVVIEHSARRRLLALATRLQQTAQMPSFESVTANAADTADMITSLVASPLVAGDDLGDLREMGEFVDQATDDYDFIIPGLLERMDRVLLVATEGAGKSMIARQVCALLAQGRHPFLPDRQILPRRTLLIDLENPPRLVQRKLKTGFVDRLRSTVEWKPNAFVWTRPGGLDLKKPQNALLLERAIEQTRPHLVALGPLYKAGFVASGEAGERTAAEVGAVLDHLREKYGIALWLEHHAPMEQGGHRSLRPFGSGYWARWPEFGIALAREFDDTSRIYRVDRFRGDRDERAWPDNMRWGNPHNDEYPWVGLWNAGPPAVEWL